MAEGLEAAVLEYISKNPGCTAEDIAKGVHGDLLEVAHVLAKHINRDGLRAAVEC